MTRTRNISDLLESDGDVKATHLDNAITDVADDSSPQLAADLDLNSNNITGTGNINTTGTVTASGTITGASFSGSGSALTGLPAANLTGTLPAIDGSALTGINTDLVSDTSPELGGDLSAGSFDINMNDNTHVDVGGLKIQGISTYYAGVISTSSASNKSLTIMPTTGRNLSIKHGTNAFSSGSNETMAEFVANGAVNLYHDNAKKFETTSTGAEVTGALTATSFSGDGSALTGISSGATLYNDISNLPTSADEGATAFVRANNTFYVRGNGQWQATNSIGTKPLQQQFLPDSTISSDSSQLGWRVHMSSDGQTAAASANSDDTPTSNMGSVYIYQKQTDGTFAFHQRVVASDAQTSDFFGKSLYVSDDGTYLAVGASNEDQNGNNSGAVYIFYRADISSNFAQQAKLDPSDGAFSDEFGTSVTLNADATYCVGGAEGEYGSPYTGLYTGAAYVFTRSGTTWTEQAKLNASDLATYDKFGCAVDISDDGTYLAVGAKGASRTSSSTSSGRGAVYIFTRSGTSWSEQVILAGNDYNVSPITGSGQFGCAVSFDDDANVLVVGNEFADTSSISSCGAVDVLTRSGTTWTHQAQLLDDQVSSSGFGGDVRVNKQGTVITVGSSGDDAAGQTGSGTSSGAVYVFDRTGDFTQWQLRNKIKHYAQDGTELAQDQFGLRVGMDNAGTTFISGAYRQDEHSTNGGAVYFITNTFTNSNTTGTGPYGTSISNLNLRRGSVIEEVAGICDGRIVRTESGVYKLPSVTATQHLTTSFAALTGSEITYNAPPGTKRVKYGLQVKLHAYTNSGISSYKLFVDDVEVTKFRTSRAYNYSTSEHGSMYENFEWIFDCDGTADAATGTFAGWNAPKTIRMEASEYHSSYQMQLHRNAWFGTTSATGDDIIAEPIITITAYA